MHLQKAFVHVRKLITTDAAKGDRQKAETYTLIGKKIAIN